jgi:hypothetical protein
MGWKINGFGARVLNNEAVVNYWSVPASGSLAADDLLKKTEVVTITFAYATGSSAANFEILDATIPAYKGEDGLSVLNRAIELGYIVGLPTAGLITWREAAKTNDDSAVEISAAKTVYLSHTGA